MTLIATTKTTNSQPTPTGAIRAMTTTLGLDLGLPVAAYFLAELLGASTYVSLLAGTVASGLRLGWVALRQRRLDPFAVFLLVLFGAGLALSFVTGDVRFMLAKDAATSCTAGVALLVSCLLNRPLAYYAAQRFAGAAGREQFLATAQTDAMRRRWFLVSLVWGAGLLTDAMLRVTAIYLLPAHAAANLSQVLMIAVYPLLLLWTIRISHRAAQPAQIMAAR